MTEPQLLAATGLLAFGSSCRHSSPLFGPAGFARRWAIAGRSRHSRSGLLALHARSATWWTHSFHSLRS